MSVLDLWHRWRWRRRDDAQVRQWRERHVGTGATIASSVQVLGWRRVRIGAHAILSEGTWLNVNDRESDEPAIIIGESSFIGRRNFLSSGDLIQLGAYCLTGPNCHFLGSDHVFETPFVPYLISGTTAGGAIRVGVNCWLGAGVTVMKDVTIGYGSIIGAGAVVLSDIPPFSIAVGNPARVVRRYDIATATWVRAAEYTTASDARLPGETAYLERLRAAHPVVPGPRIAASFDFGDL